MIYLDYNATTPVDHQVLNAMMPFFSQQYGNAASKQHLPGRAAERAVALARTQVAATIGAESKEIVFTSGATESCNLAIKGIFELYQRKGRHIVTVRTEHKAVLDCCAYLQKKGAEVTYLNVDAQGRIDLDELKQSIRPDTVLVAIMWSNNETGVIHPISEIGRICAQKGTLLFSDATQAAGKLGCNVRDAGIQLMALSGHKIYGPKGIGALYVSASAPRVKVNPILHGGGHEAGYRSGTLNVPGIVGLGKALELSDRMKDVEAPRLGELRDQLVKGLLAIEGAVVNGSGADRMSHVANMRFPYVDGEALMANLQNDLAVASGSACTAADPDPSHVLMAMGLTRDEAKWSIRFSLGRNTKAEDVDRAVGLVTDAVERLRADSPGWKLHQKGLI